MDQLINFFESGQPQTESEPAATEDLVRTVYFRPVMDFPIRMSMSMIKNVHLFGNFIVFANGQQIVIVDFNPRVKKIRRIAKLVVPSSEEEIEDNPWIFRRPI